MKLVCILFLFFKLHTQAQLKDISIPGVPYDRLNIPVYVKTIEKLPAARYFYLQNASQKEYILAQKIDANNFVFISEKKIEANYSPHFRVILIPQKHRKKLASEKVRFEKNKNGIEASVRNKPVFVYHNNIVNPPADSPQYYKRSGFIHPLYSPTGAILTDDFPVGHTHQHAIFTAWTNTTFRNAKVDFWNQHLLTGTVMHAEILEMNSGDVFGQLSVKLFHHSLKDGTVLEEIWKITLYAIGNDFLFDLESDQKNITSDTLFLHKYIYGGLAFRGSREWNKLDSQHTGDTMVVVTGEGRKNTEANHLPARYVTTYGKVKGSVQGVTIFDHPQNFRYPQPIRVHPEMPYWAYSPVVAGAFTIVPGKNYRSAYRYFVFSGMPKEERIKEVERDWIGWKW